MAEKAAQILGGDLRPGIRYRLFERFLSPRRRLAYQFFELRERQLYRRQIWRIRWQVPDLAATLGNRLHDAHADVGTQIVHQHNLSFAQAGAKYFIHIRFEGRAVDPTAQQQPWPHPSERARADQGRVAWRVAWQLGVGAHPAWRTPIAWCQIDVQADFVNHHEVGSCDLGNPQSK